MQSFNYSLKIYIHNINVQVLYITYSTRYYL